MASQGADHIMRKHDSFCLMMQMHVQNFALTRHAPTADPWHGCCARRGLEVCEGSRYDDCVDLIDSTE